MYYQPKYSRVKIEPKHIMYAKDLDFLSEGEMFDIQKKIVGKINQYEQYKGLVKTNYLKCKIESKTDDHVTVSIYVLNHKDYISYDLVNTQTYKNDDKLDWYIIALYMERPMEESLNEKIKKSYNDLCDEFGQENVDRVLSKMYKELQKTHQIQNYNEF